MTNKVIIPFEDAIKMNLYQMIVHLVEKGIGKEMELCSLYDYITKKIISEVVVGDENETHFPVVYDEKNTNKSSFHTHPKSSKNGIDCESFSIPDIRNSVSCCFKEDSVFNMETKKLFTIANAKRKLDENGILKKKDHSDEYKDEVMDFVRHHSVVKTYDEIKLMAGQDL